MTKMKVVLLVLVSLMVLGLASCDLFGLGVVGKWTPEGNPDVEVEFTLDGKYITRSGSAAIEGTYTKTDTTVTITATILGSTMTSTYSYTVDATTLKLTYEGTTSNFTRKK